MNCRCLAPLVFLGVFAGAQVPVPVTFGAHADLQQNSPTAFAEQKDNASTADDSTAATRMDPRVTEKIGNGVSAPVPLKTPEAKYTREARKKKIEGHCLVSIIVDADGIPHNLKIIRPVGYGLDEAALAAIRKYRFKPAMKNGQAVAVQMSIEVNFRLY